MASQLVSETVVESADQMRRLGAQVGGVLSAGDVLVLTGPLGAGKTTFTSGLAQSLNVRGSVTSPTFVLSRIHPSLADGPSLVHVDAYRLGQDDELDGLDLDMWLPDAVVVVEWGGPAVDRLSPSRLCIDIDRGAEPELGAVASDLGPRTVRLTGQGPRWVASGVPDVSLVAAPS